MTMRCGYVALIGRPNVGKSTLLNRLVGYRVSAIAPKPQTTRYRVEGVVTRSSEQIVFVDTPGLHRDVKGLLNKALNAQAKAALEEVDLILMLVEAGRWTDEDDFVISTLRATNRPVVLGINKVDQLKHRDDLLKFIADIQGKFEFSDIVPFSARTGHNLDRLVDVIAGRLPESSFVYPEDQITDRPMRFIAAEMIREQVMRLLEQEVPYSVAVEIESFEEEPGLTRIAAVILVEREGQKGIVIGKGGRMLKKIGTEARKTLEPMLDTKVFLKLWVKVSEDWQEDARKLARLGFDLH